MNSTYGWSFAGRFALGKEWWVSSNWGIGIAGEVVLGRLRRGNFDACTIKGYSLLISASFN